MTISTFIAPHCYRARARYDDASVRMQQRSGENEGFFFAYRGVIEIQHETAELRVYEEEAWLQGNAPELLMVPLSHNLTEIEFRMIRSKSARYEAGRVRIKYQSDSGSFELITFKMAENTYRRLGQLLVHIGV